MVGIKPPCFFQLFLALFFCFINNNKQ
jgi:hypothetical protein